MATGFSMLHLGIIPLDRRESQRNRDLQANGKSKRARTSCPQYDTLLLTRLHRDAQT
jgi:hypothetical protein